MAGTKGKKRKGLRKAKNTLRYSSGGLYVTNAVRTAKTQRTAFLKALRKVGYEDDTSKLLNDFEKCPLCKKAVCKGGSDLGSYLPNTFAPMIVVKEQEYGGYCVRCGYRPDPPKPESTVKP